MSAELWPVWAMISRNDRTRLPGALWSRSSVHCVRFGQHDRSVYAGGQQVPRPCATAADGSL